MTQTLAQWPLCQTSSQTMLHILAEVDECQYWLHTRRVLKGMKRAECHFLQLSLNSPRACMLPPQKPGNAQNLNFAFGRISRLLAGLSRKRAMIHNDSHAGAGGHGYMVVVVSAHLKKYARQIGSFLQVGFQTNKSLKPPPS